MNSVFEKVQFYVSGKGVIKKKCKSVAMVPMDPFYLRSGPMSLGSLMGGGTPTRSEMPSAPSAQAQPLGGFPPSLLSVVSPGSRTSSVLPVSSVWAHLPFTKDAL